MFVPPQRVPPPVPLVQRTGRPPDPNRRCSVELRECQVHGITEFAFYSAGLGFRRWRCKRCVGEAVTRRKQKIRRLLVAEAGGCCAVCGYDRCAINLAFHHVNPAEKSFALSSATTKALATYREEAKKCVLVCANCHGEIEARLIASPPPRASYRGSDRRSPAAQEPQLQLFAGKRARDDHDHDRHKQDEGDQGEHQGRQ